MTESLEICPTCGKGFKILSRHVCKVKAKQEFAEGIQEGAMKKAQEINVPASSLASISPDKFWAWTEGFGVQMGSIIADMATLDKNVNDIRGWCGTMGAIFKENLFALNTGMSDIIDLLKEIAGYEKTRALNLKSVEEAINGLGEVKPKPKPNSADADAIEAYEEMAKNEKAIDFKHVPSPKEGGLPKLVSYEDDKNLPEHTRKISGTLQGTSPKAMLIQFYNGKEAWVPKSCSHRDFNENDKESEQYFVIDSWVLKKNLVIGEDE